MSASLKHYGLVWMALGLLLGGVAAALWPATPLHAVATDRTDNFAIATGPLDEDTEAVYFLDFVTGELKGTALSKVIRKFFASFRANVIYDMGIDAAQNPKFMMVTGQSIFRNNPGQTQAGYSVVYVAELTSGKVAAYAAPWSHALANAGRPINRPFVLLDVMQFRIPTFEGGPQ
ncbi:MAG TPA: hypothetical protein VHC19_03505 [Pirellulales bacterium]|nr:hypothetical protein [Pirellulales bacterium]